MYALKFILILILISPKIMGQIILSETNERFENYVNEIIKRNIGKRVEFIFSSAESGVIKKTETIKIDWEKGNVIIVNQASTYDGLILEQLPTAKYIYVEGYFSDYIKKKGNYTEVVKIGDKNLVIKSFRDGKMIIENKITLNQNMETILQDHSNYYPSSSTKPIRTITTYSKKIINSSTTTTTQESSDVINRVKKLNQKIETIEITSFDKKTNTNNITCKVKTLLQNTVFPEMEYKFIIMYDNSNRIIKIKHFDKLEMSVSYK